MNSQFRPLFHFLFLAFFVNLLIFVQILPPVSSNLYDWYQTDCGTKFSCGNITRIDYPFRGNEQPQYCGYPGLVLNCQNNVTIINITNMTYRVLGMDPSTETMKIAREDVMEETCPQNLVNTTLDSSLFDYASTYINVTFLYGCPVTISGLSPIPSCEIAGYNGVYVLPGTEGPGSCNVSVTVPIIPSIQTGSGGSFNLTGLGQSLREGFDVKWKADNSACTACTGSNGQCGYDFVSNKTICYCPNPPYMSDTCLTASGAPPESTPTPGGSSGTQQNVSLTVGLAIAGAAIFGVGLGWFVFSWRQKKKRLAAQSAQTESKDLQPPTSKGLTSTYYSQSVPSYRSLSSSKSDLEKGSTYFGVQVFSYTELEEATDNFNPSRELGEGGFGTVYYGKLHDGRIVAVKRLYENNFKRVEQFMNEVEILTHLRHQNLVTLFGCTSKRSRELLLVYEYIPNGTVADHLHGKRANSGLLSWPVRLNIAIETADALAYLHTSDIIHRDVKSNNILLDNDFRVKVADFGLSRLFPTDVTHVSTAPQGTPGYVDPEYYQCYQLTSKSDVYSFGVVLIELISSKQAVDTNRHRHDINLANMAVNKIQNHTLHELVDSSLGFETNGSVRRMTTLVAELAFRCLQQERDSRPSMAEVLEALKGIKNEELNEQKAEVVDILEDDVGLLKVNPPPMSPDSSVNEKRGSSSTTLDSSG